MAQVFCELSYAASSKPVATSLSPVCTQATRSHRVRRDSNPHLPAVEKVGIEPTASTLARRDRSLSCHPHVPPRCEVGARRAYYRAARRSRIRRVELAGIEQAASLLDHAGALPAELPPQSVKGRPTSLPAEP